MAMFAAAALHCRPHLQLNGQCTAERRLQGDMAVFTRGEQAYR